MADSYVCSKAKIRCSFGDKISTLTVFPERTIWLTGEPQANISDHISMRNIAPFGKCHTTSYPATGSATAAAHGKLTPMPCIPGTHFPWLNGKNDVILQGQPALLMSSCCKCIYGGTITFVKDGQEDNTYQELEQEQSLSQEELDEEAEVELSPEEMLDGLQMALDVAGMYPGFGVVPDLLNACISACRGNWGDAAFSVLAAVPLVGDAAAATKLVKNGAKIAKKNKKAQTIANKVVKNESQTMSEAISKGHNRELAEVRAKRLGSEYDANRTGSYFDTAPDASLSSKFDRDKYLTKGDVWEQDEMAAFQNVQKENQNRPFLSVTARPTPGTQGGTATGPGPIRTQQSPGNSVGNGQTSVTKHTPKSPQPNTTKSPKSSTAEVHKREPFNRPKVDYKPGPPPKKEPPVLGKKLDITI